MKATLIVGGVFIGWVGLSLLGAWIGMLLFGALAHLTGWPVAISFWATLVLNIILGGFLSLARGKN